jgi:hypothetical protein
MSGLHQLYVTPPIIRETAEDYHNWLAQTIGDLSKAHAPKRTSKRGLILQGAGSSILKYLPAPLHAGSIRLAYLSIFASVP